jgi:hypothetical protein
VEVEAQEGVRRASRKWFAGRAVVAGAFVSVVGAIAFSGTAFAGTSGNGTATASILGGSLSVGSIGSMTALSPSIGGTANGALPSAQWADGTGTGLGWNGTVALSPLSYTGTWSANGGSPALSSTAAGSYTGTQDGVSYTVTVTSATLGVSVNFSYTSDYTGDTSGSGTANVGQATAVGAHGLTIQFAAATTYSAGNSYTVLVGTQSHTVLKVNTGTGSAITSTGTSSTAPSYVNNNSTIDTGTTVGTVNSAGAVKVLSAAVGTGASGTGYYTAAPGVSITADSNSWAATYSGTLTYSIITGP